MPRPARRLVSTHGCIMLLPVLSRYLLDFPFHPLSYLSRLSANQAKEQGPLAETAMASGVLKVEPTSSSR